MSSPIPSPLSKTHSPLFKASTLNQLKVILRSTAISDKEEEDDSFNNIEIDRGSEVSKDLLAISRIIRGTFNPLENRQLLKKARSKRSWIWDWGSKGINSNRDKT